MRIAVVDDTTSEQKYVCECIERFFKEHQMKYELAVFLQEASFCGGRISDLILPFLIYAWKVLMDLKQPSVSGTTIRNAV